MTCIHGRPDSSGCDRCENLLMGCLVTVAVLMVVAIGVLGFLLGRVTA